MGRAAGPAVFAALWLLFLTYHVDDALISYAYARSLAGGLGPVAQSGGALIEGFSNPLWVSLLVPFSWLGLPITLGSKVLQVSFGLATIWGVGDVVRRAGGTGLQSSVARLALATSGSFVVWAASGLEVAQFSLLLVGCFAAGQRGHPLLTGALIGLCAWSRPEGLAAGLVAGGAGLWLAEVGLKRASKALFTAFVLVLGLLSLRWAWFQDLVPNTVHAKMGRIGAAHLWRGWVYTAEASVAVGLPFWMVASLSSWSTGWRRPGLAAGAVLAVGCVLAVLSGGDWMSHARFVAPYLPFMVISLVPPAVDGHCQRRFWAVLGLGLGFGAGVVTLVDAVREPTLSMKPVLRLARLHQAVSDARCDGHRSVAAPDVGGLLYHRPALEVMDLGGLVEPDANMRNGVGDGDAGGWSQEVERRQPSLIHLHGGWASRTGLVDAELANLGYALLCRRVPMDPSSPTLWIHGSCSFAGEIGVDEVKHWCDHGAMSPWPGEEIGWFP